jgi:ubiquinone/menaquinone biosynthesis C-methylase UbiE
MLTPTPRSGINAHMPVDDYAAYLDRHADAARPEYQAMVRSLGLLPGARVLDAGCGGGSLLADLAAQIGPTGSIHALDLDPDNVAVAAARGASLACSFAAVVGDVTRLPWADHSFDAVWCANTLQYVADDAYPRALAELRRVVRPGGVLALKEYDVGMLLLHPADPSLVAQVLCTDHPSAVRMRRLARAYGFRKQLLAMGLERVEQRTWLVERHAPLRPVEQAFVADAVRFLHGIAQACRLPQSHPETWAMLAPEADPPLHLRDDLVWREAHVVAIGRAPAPSEG